MRKLSGFTLIELIITMTIGGILAALGIYGYMDTLRIERRKDAILALKKAALIILDGQQRSTTPICNSSQQAYNTTDNNCRSEGGFYIINYNPAGFTVNDNRINNQLMSNEILYLRAQVDSTTPQVRDNASNNQGIDCTTIYLSNRNNIYPNECQ